MHIYATFLPVLLASTAAAVDIRFYTSGDCTGSFSAWAGLDSDTCFNTGGRIRSVGFADIKATDGSVRVTGYTGEGGCDGGTVAFTELSGGRTFVCSTAGSYTGAGVEFLE